MLRVCQHVWLCACSESGRCWSQLWSQHGSCLVKLRLCFQTRNRTWSRHRVRSQNRSQSRTQQRLSSDAKVKLVLQIGVGIGVRSRIEVGVEIDVGISVGVSAVRFLDEASASLSESAGQIVRSSGRRVIG